MTSARVCCPREEHTLLRPRCQRPVVHPSSATASSPGRPNHQRQCGRRASAACCGRDGHRLSGCAEVAAEVAAQSPLIRRLGGYAGHRPCCVPVPASIFTRQMRFPQKRSGCTSDAGSLLVDRHRGLAPFEQCKHPGQNRQRRPWTVRRSGATAGLQVQQRGHVVAAVAAVLSTPLLCAALRCAAVPPALPALPPHPPRHPFAVGASPRMTSPPPSPSP